MSFIVFREQGVLIMKINKIILSLILILSCSVSVAFGYVIGNSNLGILGYPEFTSNHFHPQKPVSTDSFSIAQYRNDVTSYVDDAKEYIEAANNDIERIQESKKNAINEANDVINEYNHFIQQGY